MLWKEPLFLSLDAKGFCELFSWVIFFHPSFGGLYIGRDCSVLIEEMELGKLVFLRNDKGSVNKVVWLSISIHSLCPSPGT